MKIESIKVGRRDKEKLVIRMENGEYISARIDDAYMLKVGDEISREKADELTSAYSRTLAKKSAAATLARRSVSKAELSKKLRQKGFSEEDSEEAVEWFSERGFVDDESYADAVSQYYTARGYGRMRVYEELKRRGIARDISERVLSEIPEAKEEIISLIEKRLRGEGCDREKKAKTVAFLLRRGFGYDEIKAAFYQMQLDSEDID